jgi:hypothetical protein
MHSQHALKLSNTPHFSHLPACCLVDGAVIAFLHQLSGRICQHGWVQFLLIPSKSSIIKHHRAMNFCRNYSVTIHLLVFTNRPVSFPKLHWNLPNESKATWLYHLVCHKAALEPRVYFDYTTRTLSNITLTIIIYSSKPNLVSIPVVPRRKLLKFDSRRIKTNRMPSGLSPKQRSIKLNLYSNFHRYLPWPLA